MRWSIELLVCVEYVDVPTIVDRLLTTIHKRVKMIVPLWYKVDGSVCVSKFKMVFDKGYAELDYGDV